MSDALPAPRRILLAGASGLIGTAILHRLLEDPLCSVITPVRRALAVDHPRLLPLIGAWDTSAAQSELSIQLHRRAPLSALVCALGSTLKSAGSKAAFSAVDLDLVVRMAQLARENGATQAILVSSVGANPRSGNFYLSIKGQAEQALRGMGFARLDLLRPGLLLGQRAQSRPAEALAQKLAPLFNPLLAGALRRYRAISAQTVAACAVDLLGAPDAGVFVHEYNELRRHAG